MLDSRFHGNDNTGGVIPAEAGIQSSPQWRHFAYKTLDSGLRRNDPVEKAAAFHGASNTGVIYPHSGAGRLLLWSG